ncbi:MAG: hypothetical protein V1776_00845 [Candidatus Diapherotrites archaeon]
MVLGGGIKYIDDAFDEKTFSKTKALLVAPVIAIFWIFMMYLSVPSATILGAIFLAVLSRNKVDNIGFHVGALAIISGLIILYFYKIVDFLWGPLVFLTVAGVLDEIGNDYVDKHPEIAKPFLFFFHYRFIMKIAVFLGVYFGFYGLEYFIAFIGFDIAYASVGDYSEKLKKHYQYNVRGLPI